MVGKSIRVITVLAVLLLGLLFSLGITSCGGPPSVDPVGGRLYGLSIDWTMVKSPLTGRCYEIASIRGYWDSDSNMMAMSEVTQAEYEAYIRSREGK